MWTAEYGFEPAMGEAIGAADAEGSRRHPARPDHLRDVRPAPWSSRTVEDDPGAPFFNDTTKYVVSSTLTEATWRNSRILGGYDADAIRRLKEEVDGDLLVSGSATLVRALLEDGLVDELLLFVYPLTRGTGPRLFTEGATPSKLSLATCEAYDNGVVHLAYRPQR